MTPALVLLALVLLPALLSSGWGPGNHLEFATRVLRRRRETLPASVAGLIDRERQAYLYGNIAADIINFKAYGGHANHCHRWTIVEEMRRRVEDEAGEAFVLGYLSHLAADTISHNHFVPYHLARYARTKGLGHLYWEMSADRFVPEARWRVITELKDCDGLGPLDQLINASVPRKALSMGTNKLIFNHVLLVSEREDWRRGMARLMPIRNVTLSRGFLARFQRAAVERIRLALRPGGLELLAHVDTNGKAAQQAAVHVRRDLGRRLRPSRRDPEEAHRLAARFLVGMETPPPRGGTPVWELAQV